MDKYELRRRRLEELLAVKFQSKQASLASTIEVEPSYVSRLLYPEGKAGKKRIGEDMRDTIERKCRLSEGWLDMPLGTPLTASPAHPKAALAAREPTPQHGADWPFASITEKQYAKLAQRDRDIVEGMIALMLKTAATLAPQPTRRTRVAV